MFDIKKQKLKFLLFIGTSGTAKVLMIFAHYIFLINITKNSFF